ncbi:MAG: DUF1972 domain-containing protein [Clostridia bacterium]|nr:DUF1972 domain-containing protein [Clostridia bacterium]
MDTCRHVFIIGAKSIGQYGGYESFLDNLIRQHEDEAGLCYHIVTKANGEGCMDETKLDTVIQEDGMFLYHGARVVKLHVPQVGPAQAVLYDIKAMRYCLNAIREKRIDGAAVYVLACRIGPFFGRLVRQAHKLGCTVYINPDGHEWMRAKWSKPVRAYWRWSEALMVKHADCVVCDSVRIEQYIKSTYEKHAPNTDYIAYGADVELSMLSDEDASFTGWLERHGLAPHVYYMCCGRFVPENSFEVMIRAFMQSNTTKCFALITTKNEAFLKELDKKLHFSADPRIRFTGPVYDAQLLRKIRENAYANFHGHTVGGTNPSLLEALASTDVNLLVDVGFNREVAQDAALYWKNDAHDLAVLIEHVDTMTETERLALGEKAKERIRTAYNWKKIADQYLNLWKKSDK